MDRAFLRLLGGLDAPNIDAVAEASDGVDADQGVIQRLR
jgi:hypothetical protein